MKVIDLLIGIANKKYNELKTKFVFDEKQYNFVEFSNVFVINSDTLNWEVEIIKEDKKIEKLDVSLLGQCDNWLQPTIETSEKIRAEINPYVIENIRENTLNFQHKINEIIDYINKENK